MIFLNQETDLIWNDKYQILYFCAVWMAFNQEVLHIINDMERKIPNIITFIIDVDYFKGMCKRFGINSIPSILLIENGKEIRRIEGITNLSKFSDLFNDICIT